MDREQRGNGARLIGDHAHGSDDPDRTPNYSSELQLPRGFITPRALPELSAHGARKQLITGRCSYATWVERLRVLREMREDVLYEPSMQHTMNGLDACICALANIVGTPVTRESPRIPNSYDVSASDGGATDRALDYPSVTSDRIVSIYKSDPRSPRCNAVAAPYEEQALPGRESYTMDDVIGSLDSMEVSKSDDQIPPALLLEANAAAGHFDDTVVHKLYSRRWLRRFEAVDDILALIDTDEILATNDDSIQKAVAGIYCALTRLFKDHALKVLIKSLDLLDSFFAFMERHGCSVATSARGATDRGEAPRSKTDRGAAVSGGSEFLEALIARLGDPVSAVINCAVCALLKVAESNTIPTYEDIVNCLIRSLGGYNSQPGARSICNRLRLISTLLLRAHLYNSHGVARLSVKQAPFFETVGALCRHSHGSVRAVAVEVLAIGMKIYFRGATPNLDPIICDAAERIQPQSASVYEGSADERTKVMIAEAQASWPADLLRARTPRQC
ncbi:centrosomal of 104 kDa-like protein, putative [Babesia ovata]|uniref:Centrosomal of 104 kDa-like protein, putative n=1 Tax=Babesia ovata TaxID=189622 RepID=A0A2H6KE74_9APIC|nr:centrosomal of 104 kDa-like protein, putative [Babesia ovata]GBE61300.1 centrosomal of 104 kDa-like protein, putative [Babesia ovata]